MKSSFIAIILLCSLQLQRDAYSEDYKSLPINPTVAAQELPGTPEGFRAVTITISPDNSANLKDNSMVNVIWNTHIKGHSKQIVIAENIKILSIIQNKSDVQVTLMCTLDEAK